MCRETQCKVVQRSLAAVSSLMSFDVHFWHSSWSFVTIIIDGVACSSHRKLRKFMERRFVSLFSSLALFNLPNRSSIQKLWPHQSLDHNPKTITKPQRPNACVKKRTRRSGIPKISRDSQSSLWIIMFSSAVLTRKRLSSTQAKKDLNQKEKD